MVSGVLALFSGAMAGLEGEALTRYVLLNVAMDYWTKKRNKPKEDKRSTPSSQGSGNVSSGDVIPVVFGLASLEGQVFDVINREDGGYPVFGALGFCLPKSFAYGSLGAYYDGVDLVDRASVVTDDSDEELGVTLNEFSLIIRDQSGPGSIENMTEMLKSLKWGNDATKKVNNAICKFFNYGGFSNWNGYSEVEIANSTEGSSLTGGIGNTTYGRMSYLQLDSTLYVFPFDLSIRYSSTYYLLSNDSGAFSGESFSQLSTGDMIRVVTATGQVYLLDVVGISAAAPTVRTSGYDDVSFTPGVADPTKRILAVRGNIQLGQISSAKIIKFGGVVNRKPDMTIQFNSTEYRSNNKLAWLAQEIRDPGNAYQNITTEVAGATALIFDGCMPACETVLVDGVNTFKDLVAGYVDDYPINIAADGHTNKWLLSGKYLCNNPIAIIYEILINDSFGLGWSPDRIHIESFVEAYIYCYTASAQISDVNWKFGGYVLSSQTSANEAIDNILNHIHVDRAFTQDNQIRLFINDGNVSAAKTLDLSAILTKGDDNTPNFKVSTLETNDMFNVLKISYFRPDREFLFDSFLKITDFADIQFSETVKEENLELPGFMEMKYAKKSGLWHMARQQLETEYYEAEVGITGQDFQVGDVVRIVAHASSYDVAHAKTYTLPIHGYFTLAGRTYLAINQRRLEADTEIPDLRVGDRFTVINTEYVIADVEINGPVDETAPDVFFEPGVIVIAVDTVISSDISGSSFTFKRLQGLRCLLEDKFAKVVEVKDSNEFKTTLSLRQYSPDAYDGSGSQSYIAFTPNLTGRILNPSMQNPRDPSFIGMGVYLSEVGTSVIGTVEVQVQNISTPENAKVVVALFAKGPSLGYVQLIDQKTLYRGESSLTFHNVAVYEHGTGLPMKFFAEATAYNKDGLASATISSIDVLLSLDPVTYPDGYAVIKTLTQKPLPVKFDVTNCEYSDRLKLTSKKYTSADIVKLEVRTQADESYWQNTNNDAADGSFVTRGESQILFEQKNLTTLDRTLHFYIRSFNKAGLFSDFANDGSSHIELTNAMPAPVNESKYSVTVVNNIAKFSVSGFDDGAGNPGSTIPKDTIGYELFIGGSTTPLFFSASTEFEYALDFNEFSGSDSVVKNFKILAHDRISYTLPSGEDRATRLNATSAKEVTFHRLESAALALDALRSGTSDNKLKLLWVKDDGTEAGDYKSTFGKLMATNSYPYRQSLILEDGKTYVLSFYAKSTYGNEVKIVIDGNGPSLAEASTTSTTRTLVTYKFTTNVNAGTTPATTFSAYGVGEIYEIMLNEGDHAHTYSLHKDDELDNLGNREYKAQQAAIIEAINSNHAALLAKFDEDGARIDMTEDEIILRVKKDDVLNSIMLSEEAVSISGKNIIIDGLTRFMNSTDTIYGGVIESDGSTYAVLYNQANKTDPTGLNRLYSFNKTTGLLEKEFTFTGVTINPANKRKLTLTGISVVTGAFPAVDDFLTENNSDKGTTTIDGGRITANTVTADKILAKTIGAEKLIAREILAQIIQVIGKNTIVLSEKDGILVYPSTSYGSAINAKIIDNKTLVLLNVSLTPNAGDYAKIGYNQGGSGMDRGVFYGMNLRAIGYGSYQEGPGAPTYPIMIFDDVTPPFVGIDYESPDALVTAQFLDVSAQSKYIQISASVPDPLDGNTQKPGIRIVSGGGVEAVWTVDNFYLNSPNSLIKSANLEGGTIDIGADLVGTPDESFHVGSDGKMWIGSESYDTAPFKVDETGAVKAVALSVENVTSMPAYYNFLSKTASVSMTTADTNTQKAETLMVVTQPTPTTWPNTSRMKSILFSFFVTHTHPFPGSYKLYAGVISDYWAALSRGDFAYYSGVGSSLYIRRATDLHEYTLGTVTSNVSDPTSSLLPVTVSNFPSMGGTYLPDGYLSGLKVEFSLPGKGKRVAYIRDNSSASVGSPQANIYLHEIFSGHPSSDFYEDLSMIPSGMSEVSIVNDSMSVQATGSAWSTYSTNQGLFTSAGIGSTYGKYAGFILKFRNPSTGGVCLFRINQTWSGGTSDTLLIEVDTSAIFSKVVPLGISAGTSVVIKDCRDEIDKMYTQTSAMKAFPISGQTLSRSGASTYNYTADLTITAEILYDLPVDTI